MKCVRKNKDLPLESVRRRVSKDRFKRAESKDRVRISEGAREMA